jgi:two-component system invasion response regulator UvrY
VSVDEDPPRRNGALPLSFMREWQESSSGKRLALLRYAVDLITDDEILADDLLARLDEVERLVYLRVASASLAQGLLRFLDWWVVNESPPATASRDAEPRVTVLIADDHGFFRDALRGLVSDTPGMTVVGEVSSGEAAVTAVEQLAPRLVLMDKRMDGIGGVEAARLIRERHPEIVVVLVSAEAPNVDLESGTAYLPKSRLTPSALADVWQTHGGDGQAA